MEEEADWAEGVEAVSADLEEEDQVAAGLEEVGRNLRGNSWFPLRKSPSELLFVKMISRRLASHPFLLTLICSTKSFVLILFHYIMGEQWLSKN